MQKYEEIKNAGFEVYRVVNGQQISIVG